MNTLDRTIEALAAVYVGDIEAAKHYLESVLKSHQQVEAQTRAKVMRAKRPKTAETAKAA